RLSAESPEARRDDRWRYRAGSSGVHCGPGLIHALDDGVGRLIEHVKKWLGIDANPKGPGDERQENRPLAHAEIRKQVRKVWIRLAEHRALIEPEQVSRAEHDTDDGESTPGAVALKRSGDNREFADEAIQQREPNGTEHRDCEDHGEIRHARRESAIFANLARVAALVDHANDQEEHAGRDTVVYLLDHAAFNAVHVERENSKRAETEMTDRGIGDQPLPILLHQADERAVNNRNDGEHAHRTDNPSAG